MKYTKIKPTTTGWYWCRASLDGEPNGVEFICRIERSATVSSCGAVKEGGLIAFWMTSPGHAGSVMEKEWSSEVEWAGPMFPPSDGEDLRHFTLCLDEACGDHDHYSASVAAITTYASKIVKTDPVAAVLLSRYTTNAENQ